MRLWEVRSEPPAVMPKTMRYCKVCQKDTPHEVRSGAGVIARMCLPCLERALSYELDRE